MLVLFRGSMGTWLVIRTSMLASLSQERINLVSWSGNKLILRFVHFASFRESVVETGMMRCVGT